MLLLEKIGFLGSVKYLGVGMLGIFVAIGLIVTFIFKLPFLDEDMGKFTIPVFAVLFNVVFVMYDIMFTVFKTRLAPLFSKLKNKLS